MARKLIVQHGSNPHLNELSSDGAGPVFGQSVSNQIVPTSYPTLDNPVENPIIDRKKMSAFRPQQFGFRARPNNVFGFQFRPQNVNELVVGDAGAGVSQFRRAQFFSRIIGVGPETADQFIYDNPIGIATARSGDTRPRFWHVSFFAVSALSVSTDPPLTEGQILSTARGTPTNTVLKGRIQVYDESGSRFFDVNIHGNVSYSFYAWGVTTSILLPSLDGVQQGFEVNAQDLEATPTFPSGPAENTLATGRIIPVFQNATQYTDQVTRTAVAPSGAAGGFAFIPIPPGSTFVRIRANIGVAPGDLSAGYNINFAVVPVAGRPPALGRISLLPGTLESADVAVPNATFIVFAPDDVGDPEVEWVAVFTVEA